MTAFSDKKAPTRPSPLDDPGIQMPGRLLTLEVLVALLLKDHARRAAILAEARKGLDGIEQGLLADVEEAAQEKLRQMFVVSRAWLAKIETESAN